MLTRSFKSKACMIMALMRSWKPIEQQLKEREIT